MKIKIIDIHSENGQRDMGFCETCEYWETYDITSVEIQEVGTDNVATVEFDDDDDESIINDWKFPDWVKFNDWLNETALETYDTLTVTFNKAIHHWKEHYYAK